jgi:hypothetical protein
MYTMAKKLTKAVRKTPKGKTPKGKTPKGKKSNKTKTRTRVIIKYVQMPPQPQMSVQRRITPMQGRQVIVQERPGGLGTAVGHGLGAGAGFAVGQGVVGELFDDW